MIPLNVARALEPALDAEGCLSVTSDVRVKVSDQGDYCFSDLTVVCGEVDDDLLIIEQPTLVVEVLSPGTENHDRGLKFDLYVRIPSLREVVFVSQKRPKVERFARRGNVWIYEWIEGLDAQIEILGQSVRLADVYRNVKLTPTEPPQRA